MLVPLLAGPNAPAAVGNSRKSMLVALLAGPTVPTIIGDAITAVEVTVTVDAIVITAIECLIGGPTPLFVAFATAGGSASTGPERMLRANWALFVGIGETDRLAFDDVASSQWKPDVPVKSIDSRDHGIASETMQVSPAWKRKPVVVRRVKEVSRVGNRLIAD